jgi:phenylalanyl-tRNA synthetase beta chain
MKLSVDWLKRDWVDPRCDDDELARRLTMAGFEVEGRSKVAGEFTGVVVGEVLATERHPDADKLTVNRVAAGAHGELQIVCGAKNVRPGLKAPLAVIGAQLPGGLAIRQTKLRGVESQGMLCSARELGMGEGHEGLLELPAELPTGAALRDALALDDTVLEINFTPNRGDALSVLGLAREVAVLGGAPLRGPSFAPVPATATDTFPVDLQAPAAGPKFAGRVLRGLDPAAVTPFWMQERLRRAGLRSLGPRVDVTNYVMLELGQPMHAYDLRRLRERIEVRLARAGERLQLLDGREIELAPDVLVIADAVGPVGLAGIMGGEKSGIAADTTDVFLEVAWFAPDAIAGRARRYGLLTDASQRFERGVDPAGQQRAIERATALLLQICGGTAGPTVVTQHAEHLPARPAVDLRRAYLDRLIGVSVPSPRVVEILASLGMKVEERSDGWRVAPPSWRFDVSQPADLVEEVARVYGYNEIPLIDAPAPLRPAAVAEGRVDVDRTIELLVDRGWYEAITYTFVEPALQRRLFPDAPALVLQNPISADLAEMRVSLWPSLLKALLENVRRQQDRVRLFEYGSKFVTQPDGSAREIPCISGVAWGSARAEQWGEVKRATDFYDVKADVAALLAASGDLDAFRFEAAATSCLHPGRAARIRRGETACGWLGELHPELTRELELPSAPYLFELEVEPTLAARLPAGAEPSRFPAIRRDLAVVVKESVTFSELRQSVTVAASSLLRELKVFDVYRGAGIESGRKSVALGLILQDKSRTLTDLDADAVMQAVEARLRSDVEAQIRE